MDHLACVDVPQLAFQLLLLQHPQWRSLPCALVNEDKPGGRVLALNRVARSAGIALGVHLSAALCLAPELRASIADPAHVAHSTAELHALLSRFSPCVDVDDEPGVFFLDASGLSSLFPSLLAWAQAVRQALEARGLSAGVIVGRRRFFALLLARALCGRGVRVHEDIEQEGRAARSLPIRALALPAELGALLRKLGVTTVGGFADLPASGMARRFPPAVMRLHAMANAARVPPLSPTQVKEALCAELDLDVAESDAARLLFLTKPLIDRLLHALAERGEALHGLVLTLVQKRGAQRREEVRLAAPSLDVIEILGLVRLRLESVTMSAGITKLHVAVQGEIASVEQLQLFAQKPRRDPKAAARAFARLRAQLGNDTVVVAQLQNGHLPHARFSWKTTDTLTLPAPCTRGTRPLIRRFITKPAALPERPTREPDGWLVQGARRGPAMRICGPFLLSGGWWRQEVARVFHYVEMPDGALLWIFYDRRRRRWFLQGEVG